MRTSVVTLVALGLAAGTVSAQTLDAGPGEIKANADSKCLSITEFDKQTNPPIYAQTTPPPTRKYLAQIKTNQPRVPGVGGSKYYAAMTIYGAAQIHNNTSAGASDYGVIGIYDRAETDCAKAFTLELTTDPTNNSAKIPTAKLMNAASGGNFGLMVEDSLGLFAVIDHASGPRFSSRLNSTRAFFPSVAIGGIGGTYVDPEIHRVGNDYWLYWVAADPNNANRNRIVRNKLDLSRYSRSNGTGTVSITGTAEIVAVPQASSTTLAVNVHSPTVVHNGALMMSERVGNDSDQYFYGSLTATTTKPGHPFVGPYYNNTAWTNNGGMAGGQLVYANSESSRSPFYGAINDHGLHILTGFNAAPGTTGTVTSAQYSATAIPTLSIVLLGLTGTLPTAVPIPGIGGKLALNPAGAIPFFTNVNNAQSQVGTTSLPIPNDAALNGTSLPMQAIGVAGSNLTAFSNLAWFDVTASGQ